MQRAFTSFFSTLSLAILSCLIPVTTKAQVTPDGTTSTTVNQTGSNFTVEQGDRVGDNLFHSFDEFSVPTGGSAGFNNAANIANIFSRVTGGNISNIDGLLSASGAANLYLINPNGIIFGENARLNLGGSFFASTADSLLFEGNTEFSTVNPQAAPLLEVNIPIGLSFRDNPGDIVAAPESILFIDSQQTLALVGGDITLDGAILFGESSDIGAAIELGGLQASGIIEIAEDRSLRFPEGVTRSDISLVNESSVSTTSGGEGEVEIQARNLILNNSDIFNGVLDTANISNPSSGNIAIDATQDVVLTNSAIANNVIDLENPATAGDISLSAKNIILQDFSSIGSSVVTQGQGNSGEINLTAQENITINGFGTSVFNSFVSGNGGELGDINLVAQNLSLEGGAIIDSGSASEANSGNLNLDISDTVMIDGSFSSITSAINSFSQRDSGSNGNVNIDTNDLVITDGGGISTDISGQGNAGNVNITSNTITIDGSGSSISTAVLIDGIENRNDATASSSGGTVAISTGALSITNGGSLNAFSLFNGSGNAGNIEITASDNIFIDGGDGFSSSGITADLLPLISVPGTSGDIEIETPKLVLTNGGLISASTFDNGNAGNLTIRTSELLKVSNDAVIDASVLPDATGSAGDLTIETSQLKVINGGQINASTLGFGDAGNLTIRATDSILVTGGTETGASALQTTALEENGNGGTLNVFTPNLTVSDGATINVGNFPSSIGIRDAGTGTAGNLNLEADSISLDNGQLAAATQSTSGDGANINLQIAEDLFLENNSLVSAQAFANASGGNVTIDAGEGIILALPNENSDIIANAEQGNGGRIDINAQAIFGLEARPLNPVTNDINASSEVTGLDGTVEINNPTVDPTTGLINLPASVGDASDQISQNPCEQGVGSEFTVTGKGGLPPTVSESVNNESTQVGLIEPVPSARRGDKVTGGQGEEINNQATEAVPAQGWVFNDRGEVTLTAYSTSSNKTQGSGQKYQNTCQSKIAH